MVIIIAGVDIEDGKLRVERGQRSEVRGQEGLFAVSALFCGDFGYDGVPEADAFGPARWDDDDEADSLVNSAVMTRSMTRMKNRSLKPARNARM